MDTSTTDPITREVKMTSNQGLFNEYGRLIPNSKYRVYSQNSRRYFALKQPELNYGKIYADLAQYLNIGPEITARDFEKQCLSILDEVRSDKKMQGLLNAVRIPFIVPKATQKIDMGKEFDEKFLVAVGKSYQARFPEENFNNFFQGKLAEQMSVAPNSRYEKLLDARNKGPVVGWYFPNCLSEYAIPDQRTLMQELPPQYVLSGVFEAAAAIVGSPDLLMRKDNVYPHLLCLSAVEPREKQFFYNFEAYGWNLMFNRRSYVGAVSEYWAGGLTLF